MSNDRTNPKQRKDPANTTQNNPPGWCLRDFCDIGLRFVGNATKPDSGALSSLKYAVSPLKKGFAMGAKTGVKKHGTEGAMSRERGHKSGRIVTQLTRLTGTSG
jgi:hypothetical protein